jgi:hypothetical protein
LGRIFRYTLLAYLSARYGRHLLAIISKHGHPGLWITVAVIVTVTAVLFVIVASKRQPDAREV